MPQHSDTILEASANHNMDLLRVLVNPDDEDPNLVKFIVMISSYIRELDKIKQEQQGSPDERWRYEKRTKLHYIAILTSAIVDVVLYSTKRHCSPLEYKKSDFILNKIIGPWNKLFTAFTSGESSASPGDLHRCFANILCIIDNVNATNDYKEFEVIIKYAETLGKEDLTKIVPRNKYISLLLSVKRLQVLRELFSSRSLHPRLPILINKVCELLAPVDRLITTSELTTAHQDYIFPLSPNSIDFLNNILLPLIINAISYFCLVKISTDDIHIHQKKLDHFITFIEKYYRIIRAIKDGNNRNHYYSYHYHKNHLTEVRNAINRIIIADANDLPEAIDAFNDAERRIYKFHLFLHKKTTISK